MVLRREVQKTAPEAREFFQSAKGFLHDGSVGLEKVQKVLMRLGEGLFLGSAIASLFALGIMRKKKDEPDRE